uniref:Uncharacterized protein n=1 Tax=Tetraselmis chuii TaxID=63592 RepID=A0A7S1SXE9_9CHLO
MPFHHSPTETEVPPDAANLDAFQFRLCAVKQLPADAVVLSVATAEPSSSLAAQREAAVCWHVKPNVLAFSVCYQPVGNTRQAAAHGAVDSEPGANDPSVVLQHLAAAFLGNEARGEVIATTPRHAIPPAEATTEDAGGFHITSTAASFNSRCELVRHEANVASKLHHLLKAISTAVMSESSRQTSSATFVSRMVAVAASQCDQIDDFSKGMLAFLQCLQAKKQGLAPVLDQLERIEKQVAQLETVTLRLDSTALELERVCCDIPN